MRGKAIRRHHYQRLKRRRKRYWSGPIGSNPTVRYAWTEDQRLGFLATTPQNCSCRGCGNQRKWEGPTRQERKAELDGEEQIQEIRGELSEDSEG